MKVRCQVIEEQDALMPDIDDCRNAFVWKCRDCAPGATQDSVFVYELTASEQARFFNIGEGKFVELSIESFSDIWRPKGGIVHMKGGVSKFDCDHTKRPEPLEGSLQREAGPGGRIEAVPPRGARCK